MTTNIHVFDLDGVCADVRHRLHLLQTRPKQWDEFFEMAADDSPLSAAQRLTRQLTDDGALICFLSGRPERNRNLTTRWLQRHDFPQAPIYLRPDWDRRPARLFKAEKLQSLGDPTEIAMVYDDDSAVIAHLKALGYATTHVTWMGATAGEQISLFDAQHTGET